LRLISRRWLVIGLLLAAVGICMVETQTSPAAAIRGVPSMLRYLRGMWPPAWSAIPGLLEPLLESVEIAVVAIAWASFGALILGLLGARNINSIGWLYQAVRILLNTLRGIPALLYALVFVAMVGLGPFPGVLGLACHCTGSLGRYFAEAFESSDPGLIEAGKSVGAHKGQIIVHFVLSDTLPLLIGYILYYFEYCIRTSTLLGFVGAGGIGVPLLVALRLFRTREVAAILMLILATVFTLDRTSAFIRRQILGGEHTLHRLSKRKVR